MIRLLAHPPPSLSRHQVVTLSQSSCVSQVELTDGRVGGKWSAKSQIIRPRESLALYKLFNTFWLMMFLCQKMEVEFDEEGDVELGVFLHS